MILILAPAKNMSGTGQPSFQGERMPSLTRPVFLSDARRLAGELKKLAPWQLETVLSVNPELALKAFEAYQEFDTRKEGTPALLAYQGLQYQHISPGDFTAGDFAAAQERICIISALYGVLRPLDGILPYRLEMQCRYPFFGKRLYRFWGERIWQSLRNGQMIVNLASQEYAGAVLPFAPAEQVVTCEFLVSKRGKLTCVATAAKMARGEMARMTVRERLTRPEQLKDFQWDGFSFQPELSGENRYIFAKLNE